jgi:hypothetical protein
VFWESLQGEYGKPLSIDVGIIQSSSFKGFIKGCKDLVWWVRLDNGSRRSSEEQVVKPRKLNASQEQAKGFG